MGIGVSNEEVLAAANIIGCSTFSTPFSYLGVKVGMSPSRRKAWDEIIGKVRFQFIPFGNVFLKELILCPQRSFSRLFALELHKRYTVADKLIDASFVASFRRNPRGGVEEEQLHHLVELVGSISLSPSNDRWAWLLGSSAWKVCLDKLPTRLNLSLRGIDIPSIICPNCGLAGESCSHLFYSCNLARTLWRKIARWWEIDIPDFSCYEEWIAWFKTTRFSKAQKEMLEGVFYVMWWMIWKFRNQVLFGSSHPRMELLFDDIVSYSFTWCSNRCKINIDWISWMNCPKSISL
ncbi:RNA-directed DNA polymerase, eukaryota [Tanacetum coccineum]